MTNEPRCEVVSVPDAEAERGDSARKFRLRPRNCAGDFGIGRTVLCLTVKSYSSLENAEFYY